MSAGLDDILVSTKETLNKLLSETLSANEESREAAKQGLKKLEVTEDFGIHLTEILVAPESELPVRQLASKILQSYVETRWRHSSNEIFEFPEIMPETKNIIKELLLPGLRELTSEIRWAVAQIISTIAHWDRSKNWPRLYDVLVDCLSRESDFAVHEVMRVLRTSIRYIGQAQLPNIGPVILQAMYQIYQDENQYSVLIRSHAVEIFTKIIGFLGNPDYCKADFIQQSIKPVLPMFCEKFMRTLTEDNETERNDRLKTDVVKAIGKLTSTLPKCITDFLPQILPLIWQTLAYSAEAYRERTVDEEHHSEDDDIDSDGEIMNDCDTLVIAIFEFMSILISGPRGYATNLFEYEISNDHWFYLRDSLPPEAIQHLMIFMELTDEQIKLWTDNPSQFLIEGEMDCMEEWPISIRCRARNLLFKLVERPEGTTANSLLIVILKRIEAENTLRMNGGSGVTQQSWKSHETLLLAFCIAKDIIIEKQKAKMLNFDMIAFLENVVLADSNNSESHPLLVARCLYLGGIYADQMPVNMMSRFLKATINGLKNQAACVKICAARAAWHWFRIPLLKENNGDANMLKSHFPAMFQGLLDLGNQLMTPEGLKLVLESCELLISLDKTFCVPAVEEICTLTITSFFNFYDSAIFHACEEIFRELTLHPECVGPLQARLVPKLVEIMTVNPSNEPKSGKVALDMLRVLVQHSPRPLNSILIDSAFPATHTCILDSDDDRAILESGGKTMRTYLSAATQQVISYRDNDDETGLQYALQVATKLLKSQCSEFVIEDACEIVKMLIKPSEIVLRDDIYTKQLLLAMLSGMQFTDRVLVRKLSVVFAHLIDKQPDILLEFLSTTPGQAERTTFNLVVSEGFCKEHKLFEQNERKVVNSALSKILQYGVTRPEFQFHGEQAIEGDAGTTAPMLVVICKLISDELSRRIN